MLSGGAQSYSRPVRMDEVPVYIVSWDAISEAILIHYLPLSIDV
jgi:hypothetical protein